MKLRPVLFICLLCVAVSACSSTARMEDIAKTQPTGPANPALTQLVDVGDVSGQESFLFRPITFLSNDEFKGGLQKALARRGYLVADGKAPRYLVDAVVTYKSEGGRAWEDLKIEADGIYTLKNAANSQTLLVKKIHTNSDAKAMRGGDFLENFLFTSQNDNLYRSVSTVDIAASRNIGEFLQALDAWHPAR